MRLTVNNLRSVKSASIALNGITVVSGVNGCGKSTLSKLLYYIIRNSIRLDELVINELNVNIRPYVNVIEIIQSELYYKTLSAKASRPQRNYLHRKLQVTSFDDARSFLQLAKELGNQFIENITNDETLLKSNRVMQILQSTLKLRDVASMKSMLDILYNRLSDHIVNAEKRFLERSYVPLKNRLNDEFGEDISKNVMLTEYGDAIFGSGVKNIPILHAVGKVAYVDTPMAIGLHRSGFHPSYWNEINRYLEEPPKRGYKRTINSIIKNRILKGDVSYEDDIIGGFKYKRLDGTEFDLSECATGIKSFAMLQLLLKNMFLDETALLIIDEPEAHLHPQWIVEYANLIVLLQKHLGVKFFIASHSTDMVSAIRYISENEGSLDSVSFYVAKEKNDNLYEFQNLGTDIEPIFESFNKSYDVLERYAKEN